MAGVGTPDCRNVLPPDLAAGALLRIRSGNADEFLARAAPLVADHPYRVFLESHTSNFAARKTARGRLAKIDERMEGIDLRGVRRGRR